MMQQNGGFTLLEVTIAAALILIVSALGLVAIQSSARAVELNQALANIQQDARGAMLALSREVEFAVKPAPTGYSLPPNVQGIRTVQGGNGVVFQVPTNREGTSFSQPITVSFDEENQRLEREQAGAVRVLGSANTIEFAEFDLRDDDSVLRITMTVARPIASPTGQMSRFTLQTDVYLMN